MYFLSARWTILLINGEPLGVNGLRRLEIVSSFFKQINIIILSLDTVGVIKTKFGQGITYPPSISQIKFSFKI